MVEPGVLALVPIVFLAFTVEGTLGFGSTVLTLALAAHLLPVEAVVAAMLPVNLAMSGWLALCDRAEIDGRLLFGRVLPWMGLGTLAGLRLHALGGEWSIKAAFAVLVVLLAVLELARMTRARLVEAPPLPPARAAAGLVLAGLVHGVFATGGPLAVYVLGRALVDKGRFRATLSALWILLNLLLLASYARAGDLDGASLRLSAALVPSLLLGGLLGQRLHERVPLHRFRLGVFVVLLLAGISLLLRALGGMGLDGI